MWIYTLVVAIIAAASASAQSARFPTETDIVNMGHFGGIVPSSYTLSIEMLRRYGARLPRGPNFRGTVTMSFKSVIDNLQTVYLHSESLELFDVLVKEVSSNRIIRPRGILRKNTTIGVRLQSDLRRGDEYMFICDFEGQFHPDEGVYYKPGNGAPVAAIGTLLEMSHARKVFPCVDHPYMKANFQLCVQDNQDGQGIILSNTGATFERVFPHGGQEVCFAKTPKLPTYLLAFAVLHNYQRVTSRHGSGFPVQVYFAEDSLLQLAHEWVIKTQRIVDHLERRFKHRLPLESLSMILFHNGPPMAMENFGLISFFPGVFSDVILTHEIVHHLIGNDITVKNWNEICLQEGLTTLLGVLVSNEVLWTDDSLETRRQAMAMEPSMKPLVHSHTQMPFLECYQKAPLVLSTIQNMVGKTAFDNFVGNLLGTFHMGNPGFDDWLRLLGDISKPASNALKLYSTQRGFPVLKANIEIRGGYYTVSIQEYFYSPERGVTVEKFGERLPLEIHAPGYRSNGTTMSDSEFRIKVPVRASRKKWMIFDTSKMYYAVVYNEEVYDAVRACFSSQGANRGAYEPVPAICPTPDQIKAMGCDRKWAEAQGLMPRSSHWECGTQFRSGTFRGAGLEPVSGLIKY